MFEDIISLENLLHAWREFRRGKRGKSDVQVFEHHLEDNLFALHNELRFRQYRHGAYERFHLFDPKYRIIHKAQVRDRVVHHAVYRILAPIFEHSFIYDSYSCQLGKGTHAGVNRLNEFVRKVSGNYTRQCWALKCDIRKFFDNIDHQILMNMLARRVSDSNTLWLLREIIESFPCANPVSRERERERVTGLPIGNLTSQLFANIYLNKFDHFIKESLRVKHYLRYTDDFMILHDKPVALVSLLPMIRRFLREQLALELHPQKIQLHKLRQGIDFLGYVILPHYRVLRTKTKRRLLRRLENWPPGEFATVESYLGLFKHCQGFKLSRVICEKTNYDECWQCGIL